LSLRRCFPRKSFLSSSSNPNHSIFSVASDRDLLLGKSSASFSFLCILAVCSLFIAWNHPENVVRLIFFPL
ncbi:unnamed protein product, partial [Brassica oleracea var. botrytis]